jgi:hypothetical protein
MTQQYLTGELSLLLEQLEAVGRGEPGSVAVRDLRTEAEATAPSALAAVLMCALELTDSLCWKSVTRGDAAAFDRQAATATQLREFGVCARLLEEVD